MLKFPADLFPIIKESKFSVAFLHLFNLRIIVCKTNLNFRHFVYEHGKNV